MRMTLCVRTVPLTKAPMKRKSAEAATKPYVFGEGVLGKDVVRDGEPDGKPGGLDVLSTKVGFQHNKSTNQQKLFHQLIVRN